MIYYLRCVDELFLVGTLETHESIKDKLSNQSNSVIDEDGESYVICDRPVRKMREPKNLTFVKELSVGQLYKIDD